MTGLPDARRLLAVEPTYRDAEHAAVNAGLLRALSDAGDLVAFAATRAQRGAVCEADDGLADLVPWQEIAVMEPGGVHLRRMRAQWQTLSRLVRAYRPDALVLLSAGPETLFVMRGLVALHPRLRIFAVMHGNLATATGWRSRDPRRRLIDLRAGLRVARHPRVHLVVLEEHIRAAALRHGLARSFLVWPHTVVAREAPPARAWRAPERMRIAWIGTANRQKGFDDFLALHGHCGRAHDWIVAGRPTADYDTAALAGLDLPERRLDRAAFLVRVRAADYAFMAFRGEYELTASGSLLDCINQRMPLLAVRNAMLDGLAREYGPIGYLCDDLDGVRRLLDDPHALRDEAAYAAFQRALDAAARERLPDRLARTMRDHLA